MNLTLLESVVAVDLELFAGRFGKIDHFGAKAPLERQVDLPDELEKTDVRILKIFSPKILAQKTGTGVMI
jgi:hypothetical protein